MNTHDTIFYRNEMKSTHGDDRWSLELIGVAIREKAPSFTGSTGASPVHGRHIISLRVYGTYISVWSSRTMYEW